MNTMMVEHPEGTCDLCDWAGNIPDIIAPRSGTTNEAGVHGADVPD